jgi:hypothetical protein
MAAVRIRGFLVVALVVAVAWTSLLSTLDGRWDKATVSSFGQAVGTLFAVMAALWIATRDRQRALAQAASDAAAERELFVRRRDYDECLRLLELVERYRREWEAAGDPLKRPRSIEATALIRALWGRRNWWGTAVDWYVESRKPGWRFSDGVPAPDDVFAQMQSEIVDAIMKLDAQDRQFGDVVNSQKTSLRPWIADQLTRLALKLAPRRSKPDR